MAPACGRDGRSDHRCRRPVDGGRWPPVVGGKRSGVPARQGAHPTGWGRPHRPCRRGCPTSRPVGGGTRWPPVACVQYRRPAGGRGGGSAAPCQRFRASGPDRQAARAPRQRADGASTRRCEGCTTRAGGVHCSVQYDGPALCPLGAVDQNAGVAPVAVAVPGQHSPAAAPRG